MRLNIESSLRKSLLLLAATAAALAALVGLPVKRAMAQRQTKPGAEVNKPPVRLEVIQPKSVSPTTETLLKIADQALSDNTLAGRISRDPDGVAQQYHLSNSERLVLRHMNSTQFEVARRDAARLVATRVSSGRPMPPGATNGRQITERMIVGRAILAAVGRSYQEAASANACCPWSKAIEVGVGGDPAAYNEGFRL